MKKNDGTEKWIKLICAIFFCAGITIVAIQPSLGATLINLATQVKGILLGANGGLGVTLTGSPTLGYVPTATSSSAAVWTAGIPVNPIITTQRTASWVWSAGLTGGQIDNPPTSDYYTAFGGIAGASGCATATVPPCATQGNGQGFLSALNWLVGQNIDFQEEGQLTTVVAANTCVIISVNDLNDLHQSCGTLGSVQNAAAFLFGGTLETTDWGCQMANGSTRHLTTSSIAADTNAHTFEIKFDDVTPNVVFSIDGVTACTETTDLPVSGSVMQHGFYVGGSTANLYREFFYYMASGNAW